MKKSKSTKRKSFKRRILSYIAITFSCFFIVSILLTLPLRWLNPLTTSFILQEMFADKKIIVLDWVPYENIAKTVPISVVASEDQKFPDHYGFDFEALYTVITGNSQQMRGASTISQQLVKNLYLWPGRSLVRKGVEVYFTGLLEAFLPKRRILEIYLNVVEFGPEVYGVGIASRQLFAEPASRINGYQAALLAAILPNPKERSVVNPSPYIISRAEQIQKQVQLLGGAYYLKDL